MFVCFCYSGLQAKPYLQATERLVKPDGEQRDEASIYLDLAKASGINIFDSWIAQKLLGFAKWYNSIFKLKTEQPSIPQTFFLSLILKICGQLSFKNLLKKPHGILRKQQIGNDFLGKRVLTENGLINLTPAIFFWRTKNLEADFELEKEN